MQNKLKNKKSAIGAFFILTWQVIL